MFLKAARATNEDPTEKFLNMAAFIYKDEGGESNEPGTSEDTMHVQEDEVDDEDTDVLDDI